MAKDFGASADVTYAADFFTAKAGVVFGTTFGTDDSSLCAKASISFNKNVSGATIALAYKPVKNVTNFLKDGTKLGTVYASATIAF